MRQWINLFENINDAWFDNGAQKVYKIPNPVKYQTARHGGTMETLEGPVNYQAGYKIMTGPEGEKYPIPSEKFEELYDDHGNGSAVPKKIVKYAKLADHDGSLKTSWGETLEYTAHNDYIIKYASNEYGVVKRDIFAKTYQIE